MFSLPTALLHIVLHLKPKYFSKAIVKKESTYSQYTDMHLCQYMAAECVSVDHRADQSGRECPEQKRCSFKVDNQTKTTVPWNLHLYEALRDEHVNPLSLDYVFVWGSMHACVCVCVSMTPAAGSSAKPHHRLDRCVLSQHVFMEMALIEFNSCSIWSVVETALVFFVFFNM